MKIVIRYLHTFIFIIYYTQKNILCQNKKLYDKKEERMM